MTFICHIGVYETEFWSDECVELNDGRMCQKLKKLTYTLNIDHHSRLYLSDL